MHELNMRNKGHVMSKTPHILEKVTEISKVKPDWQNIIDLNRIIYQSVVGLQPIQICTITYNEAKDVFVYRLYR